MKRTLVLGFVFLLLTTSLTSAFGADDGPLRRQAADALRKATDFFLNEVSTEGGYLWRYSEDLSKREGEGRVSDATVWVQPPGTPSIGIAFLEAYRNTGDSYYLEAARKAGYCLVRGQLESGGWDYRINFAPKDRSRYAYRVDGGLGERRTRNTTTLDDNVTQEALRLLMRLDAVLGFEDKKIHEAVQYALDRLLAAQFPIGAWPQRFTLPPDPGKFPVRKASYPESWSRVHPKASYSAFYTFNDNAISDVLDVMFEAWKTYDDDRFRKAADRAGEFILMAQMPEPQPAWAQQYDVDMHPAWARRFEPPSITGGESQGVMRTLLTLYRETGERKYLEPLPGAIAYFRRSLLPDGSLARFYELQTNTPLFFTKKYELTYSDADMPTHYAFKVGSRIDSIDREYQRLAALDPSELASKASKAWKAPTSPRRSRRKASKSQVAKVKKVIAALDERGRWVEAGTLKYHGDDDSTRQVIDCRTFRSNVGILSAYLATAPE